MLKEKNISFFDPAFFVKESSMVKLFIFVFIMFLNIYIIISGKMPEKKESVIKLLGKKIKRLFRGELESEKRLEELRKKYEDSKAII